MGIPANAPPRRPLLAGLAALSLPLDTAQIRPTNSACTSRGVGLRHPAPSGFDGRRGGIWVVAVPLRLRSGDCSPHPSTETSGRRERTTRAARHGASSRSASRSPCPRRRSAVEILVRSIHSPTSARASPGLISEPSRSASPCTTTSPSRVPSTSCSLTVSPPAALRSDHTTRPRTATCAGQSTVNASQNASHRGANEQCRHTLGAGEAGGRLPR